jgi:hypothetical protein
MHVFFEGCKRISEIQRLRIAPSLPAAQWKMDRGVKRIRIVRDGSAHAFVDIATGDVLKPASWAAPAKHARGNIFDEHNGLGSMGPYGPAYLK